MKVKVKRVRGGSMGDQRNYGLVTGSIWNYEDKPTSNAVGDTIQESPRDKANIEAERGETVVGDIDSDGMLEHLKIGGKRHHSGGTPLNVPDGSFVFSDTSALRIKNKDLLKNIFGMNSSKSGVTPAQVARRYQLNDYKELLNDPWADPLEKRTAQMMMDNNLKKLGQLALIQESMKGFPDGIPNIALPLFASDMGQQQMMRKGGLVKYQGTQKSQVKTQYRPNLSDEQITQDVANKAYRQAKKKIDNAPLGSKEEKEALKTLNRLQQDFGFVGFGHPYYEYYKDSPQSAQKSNVVPFIKDGVKYVIPLDNVDVSTPEANQAMHNLVRRKEAAKKGIGFATTTPGTSTAFAKEQTLGVEAANRLYNDAILSNDPATLKKAAEDIYKINIQGWSTPFGVLGQGAISAVESIATGLPLWLYQQGLLKSPPTKEFSIPTKPTGFTWQEKIYDMGDILTRKADQITSISEGKESTSNIAKSQKQYNQQYNKVVDLINTVMKNPTAYDADMISKVLKWNEVINNPTFLGIPTRFGSENPYQAATRYRFANLLETPEGASMQEAYNDFFGGGYAEAQLEQTDLPATETTSSAPGVGVVTQENGVVSVDPTARQRSTSSAGQPTTSQKAKLTDAEIIALLKAQGQPDSVTTPEYILEWRRLNERDGGTINSRRLPKAQNGTETYDLLNRRVQEAARKKNQAITFPYSYYERGPSIGSQTKKRGYILSPEGILYKPGQKEPKIDELIKNVPIDWSTYQNSTTGKRGVEAWKEDIRNAQGAESPASDWYIKKYNEYSIAKTGEPWFDLNQTGVRIPGRQWSQPAIFSDIPAEPQQPLAEPKTETKKSDDIQVKRQEYAPGLAMRPEIWNFDKVNMANAMLNRAMIERGADPTLYRYNPYVAEAVYMDPSYDIAAQQGALATATQALGATAPTQQAMANILQAQAQTAEPIAQITSQTNKANIALANQMAQQQAQVYNQAQLQNIQFQKRWEDEKEVLRQQYQNALAEGNTELAKSIMQAMKNAATTAWVNATQDQYAIDPATGSVYFKGGKDPRLFGATESDYATMGAGIDAFASAAGISREKAAELYLKYIAGKGSSKKSKVNPLTGEEARYGGKYKFGGEVFNPIDDIWN